MENLSHPLSSVSQLDTLYCFYGPTMDIGLLYFTFLPALVQEQVECLKNKERNKERDRDIVQDSDITMQGRARGGKNSRERAGTGRGK